MIRTVYAEIKLNIPFMQHGRVVKLIELNSGDMGTHHKDKTAAIRMMLLISKYMHMQLLTHLSNEKSGPLSLILDTTTDLRGDHYLITYQGSGN